MPRRIVPPIVSLLVLLVLLAACNRQTREGEGQTASAGPSATPGMSPQPGSTGSETGGRYGAFQAAFTDVARKAVPSVVSITTERTVAGGGPADLFGEQDPFEFFFGPPRGGGPRRESGLGSGFLVDGDGTILTNNHVVEGAQKLRVQLADEREFDAEVVGTDPATDLAVVRLRKKPGEIKPLDLGDSDQLLIGEWVVAVGAPFGLFETVTAGIVSAKGRQNTGISAYGNFIQTDAAINPGNSGGPLVNLEGKVVGINTAIFSQSGGYQGVGFAIPVNLARKVMESLLKEGKVTRGWLGVSIQPLTADMAEALGLPDRRGALIADVLEGGPAEDAGLRRGDVVLTLEGKPVADANDLMNQVALLAPGTTAGLGIWRDGKKRAVKAKVGRRDEERLAAQGGGGGGTGESGLAGLGLEAADLDDGLRSRYRIGSKVKRGVVVTGVEAQGPAAEAGLQEGDVLLEANRRSLAAVKDLREAVAKVPEGRRILLLIHRGGSTFYAALAPR